jgi:hypothetical protein
MMRIGAAIAIVKEPALHEPVVAGALSMLDRREAARLGQPACQLGGPGQAIGRPRSAHGVEYFYSIYE